MYDFVTVLLPMVTTVNETISVLTVLFTFNATDADGDPLTFTLTCSDSSNAESYFYVEQIRAWRVRVGSESDRISH